MIRVLIIGNSHVGAVARAYGDGSRFPGFDVDFLTVGGPSLAKNIQFDGVKIRVDADSLGADLVAPDLFQKAGFLDVCEYDRVFIYGFQMMTAGDGLNWVNLVESSQKAYSSALWNDYVRAHILNTDHYRLLAGIGNPEVLRRIISLPCPLPSMVRPEFYLSKLAMNDRIKQVFAVAENEITQLGVGFHHLPETLLDGCGYATSAKFKSDRKEDFAHLNVMGGDVVLLHLVEMSGA